MKIDQFPVGKSVPLKAVGSWPESAHFCHRLHFAAVVAAWHVKKPLLVRGEAGVGKSQLANAVAQILDWQFMSVGIQPQTDYADLLWRFDAVGRLAIAQLLGSRRASPAGDQSAELKLPPELDYKQFIRPGPLWWAFRPESARELNQKTQSDTCPFLRKPRGDGTVLLIDEIDKADSRLPNGLLEITANGDFSLPEGITDDNKPRHPLVIITSNDERQLPIAFLRRCLVLDISLPQGESLVSYLLSLADARVRQGVGNVNKLDETSIKWAANEVLKRREELHPDFKLPGVAEFLDLLEALGGLEGDDAGKQEQLNFLSGLILDKRIQLETV